MNKNVTQKLHSYRTSFIEILLPLILIFFIGLLKTTIYDSFQFDYVASKPIVGHLDANYAMYNTLSQTDRYDFLFCFVGSDDGWEAFQSFLTSPTKPLPPNPVQASHVHRFNSREDMLAYNSGRYSMKPFLVGVVETITTTPNKKKLVASFGEATESAPNTASAVGDDGVLMTYNYDLYQDSSVSYRYHRDDLYDMSQRTWHTDSYIVTGPYAVMQGIQAHLLRKHGAVTLEAVNATRSDGSSDYANRRGNSSASATGASNQLSILSVSKTFSYHLASGALPKGTGTSYLRNADTVVAISISIALLIPFLVLVSLLVAEKETKMVEMLRISGITLPQIAFSWACYYAVAVVFLALSASFILSFMLIQDTSMILIFITLVLCLFNMLAICILFSSLFTSTRSAQLVLALTLALSIALISAIESARTRNSDTDITDSVTGLLALSFAPTGMKFAISWLIYMNRVTVSSVTPSDADVYMDGYSLTVSYTALLVGTAVFSIVGFYINAVEAAMNDGHSLYSAMLFPLTSVFSCFSCKNKKSKCHKSVGLKQRFSRKSTVTHVTSDAYNHKLNASGDDGSFDDDDDCGDDERDLYAQPAQYHRCAIIEHNPSNLNNGNSENSSLTSESSCVRIEEDNEILRIRNLRKVYMPSNVTAVKRLNLDIHRGELFALLGHNGAGKSTILNSLTGFCKPTLGSARIDGVDVRICRDTVTDASNNNICCATVRNFFSSAAVGRSRSNAPALGMCPQVDILYPDMTPRDHFTLFARLRGVPVKRVHKEVDRWLAALNLLELADTRAAAAAAALAASAAAAANTTSPIAHTKATESPRLSYTQGNKGTRGRVLADAPVSTLSGGQRRCVSLGIALIGDPKLVILDEPTAGLDVAAQASVRALLQEQRRHRAILLTTHSMEEAEICDRIGILANGSLQTVGSSLFLKRTFGAGYTLTVMRTPEETLTETAARGKNAVAAAAAALAVLEPTAAELAVQEVTRVRLTLSGRRIERALTSAMPNLVTLSDFGGEMTFAIPTEAAPHLSEFLELIERDRVALCIESFAVSATPLSDVFFTVANASVVDDDAPNDVVLIPTVQIKTCDFATDKITTKIKVNNSTITTGNVCNLGGTNTHRNINFDPT
mgnify:CR=1 FL=1